MIKLFRRKKVVYETQTLQTAIAWLDNRLRIFATYLSHKTEQLQPRKVAAMIIASCLFFSVCLGLAVFRTAKGSTNIRAPAIRASLIKIYQQNQGNDVVLERIRHFHHYLDSLRGSNFFQYDSLMKNRPHLLDSIVTVEQLSNE